MELIQWGTPPKNRNGHPVAEKLHAQGSRHVMSVVLEPPSTPHSMLSEAVFFFKEMLGPGGTLRMEMNEMLASVCLANALWMRNQGGSPCLGRTSVGPTLKPGAFRDD